MDETDRTRALAQSEFEQHEANYDRLQGIVNMVLTSMEFHAAQMALWQTYLADLAIDTPDNVVPFQRVTPPTDCPA